MNQLGRGDGGATATPDLILRAALLIVGAAALG